MPRTIRRLMLAAVIAAILSTSLARAAQKAAPPDLAAAAKHFYIVLYGDPGYGGYYKAGAGADHWAEDLGTLLYGAKGWIAIRGEPANKLIERYYVVLYGASEGPALYRQQAAVK